MLENNASALKENQLTFATKKVTVHQIENLLVNNGWHKINNYHFNVKTIKTNQMVAMLQAQGWK